MVKSTILLKNVSATQIILSYYTQKNKIPPDLSKNDEESLPQSILYSEEDKSLPISEILHEKSKRAYYFLDTHKIQNKLWGVMIDVTMNGPLPNSSDKACWNCTCTFHYKPIGCPLRYNPHKTSGVEKERYEEKLKSQDLPIETNDFFETEGIFCGAPCVKAYIKNTNGSPKYKNSLALLSLLLNTLYQTNTEVDIPTAPDPKKTLKKFGGHLTIEEYRASLGLVEYKETVNIRRPYMYCSSQYLAEKKIKLFKSSKTSE